MSSSTSAQRRSKRSAAAVTKADTLPSSPDVASPKKTMASARAQKRKKAPPDAPDGSALAAESAAVPEGDLAVGEDGKLRCKWALRAPDYMKYHDEEWGRKRHHTEDQLYERLTLEGFQSGLSWLTILRKRDNFRKAFANFHIPSVAAFSDKDVERLLQDSGIVRHRGKIEAAINNAKALMMLKEKGITLQYLLQEYTPTEQVESNVLSAHASKSKWSEKLSLLLRKRTLKFVGPTTMQSTMQACGYVNAHLKDCCMWAECEKPPKSPRRDK